MFGHTKPVSSLKIKDMDSLYSSYVYGERFDYANPFKYKTNLKTTHALENVMGNLFMSVWLIW